MKKVLKTIVLISGIFLAFSVSAFADGRNVTIFLKNGNQKSGELLSVRDSLISFVGTPLEDDEDVIAHPEMVEIVFVKDIEKVRVEENDVSGAGKGALIGASLLGGSFLAAGGSQEIGYLPVVAAVGAFYGMIGGWVVAIFASDDEETVRPSAKSNLQYIRDYSRFYDEPRYVRDIIDNLLKAQK